LTKGYQDKPPSISATASAARAAIQRIAEDMERRAVNIAVSLEILNNVEHYILQTRDALHWVPEGEIDAEAVAESRRFLTFAIGAFADDVAETKKNALGN
jgi:hypothetical protein